MIMTKYSLKKILFSISCLFFLLHLIDYLRLKINKGGILYLEGYEGLLVVFGIAFLIIAIVVYYYEDYTSYGFSDTNNESFKLFVKVVVFSFLLSAIIFHIYQFLYQNNELEKRLQREKANTSHIYYEIEKTLQDYYSDELIKVEGTDRFIKRHKSEERLNNKLNGILFSSPLNYVLINGDEKITHSNISDEEIKQPKLRWIYVQKPVKVGNMQYRLKRSINYNNFEVKFFELSKIYMPYYLVPYMSRENYAVKLIEHKASVLSIMEFCALIRNFLGLWCVVLTLMLSMRINITAKERFRDINEELIEQQRQKETAYLELENFRQTYNKIKSDFITTIVDSKNSMQVVQSSWDYMEKQAAKLGRHDVINALRSLESYRMNKPNEGNRIQIDEEQVNNYKKIVSEINLKYNIDFLGDTYSVFIEPCINRMHQELLGLEKILDLTVQDYNLEEVIQCLSSDEIIPKGITRNNMFSKNIINNISKSWSCKVVLSKLESIVFNLIANSAKANQDYFEKHCLDENFNIKDYVGKIWFNISLREKNNKSYLCLEVKDNGGGFPEDIINDVYRKPVRTTKDNRDHGEATVYIGFFVKLMNGFIEAENFKIKEGELGAITRIYLPYSLT